MGEHLSLFQMQSLHDRYGDRRRVEGVEVQSGGSQLEQPLAEADAEVDRELEELVLVVLDQVEGAQKLLRDSALAELRNNSSGTG